MYMGYRFRLYPNQKQQTQINRTLGCCRFVFNYYLAEDIKRYKNKEKHWSNFDCSKDLTNLKKQPEVQWLNEVSRSALDKSLGDLNEAFLNFFREQKKGNMKWGFPKFKKKHDYKQSYSISNNYSSKECHTPLIDIKGDKIKIPKLGWTKFVKSRDCIGKIINITVSKSPSNKYFISIILNTTKEKLSETKNKIGIDLGIRNFGATSNGELINNPRFYEKSENKLKRLSHQLSKKKKGGKNYNKTRIKLAKLHEHIKNQRTNFLHRLSTKLIHENQMICLEKLDIRNMLEKHWFSKQLQDVSWYEFQMMLNYKANWYGRQVIYVDLDFPSSQLCSNCEHKNEELGMEIIKWVCPQCNTKHDRDLNAAKNILQEGLRKIA
jgi:putative transposase